MGDAKSIKERGILILSKFFATKMRIFDSRVLRAISYM